MKDIRAIIMEKINTKLLKLMLKLRQNKFYLLFCVKRGNILLYLFLRYEGLANISASIISTLVVFCNIQFGLFVDTYWLPWNSQTFFCNRKKVFFIDRVYEWKRRVHFSNVIRQFKCISKVIFPRRFSLVNLLHICKKPF